MDSENTRQRLMAGSLIVLALAGAGWQLMIWWTRPPAVEYDNLKYIQLLTTAVSYRSVEMVDKVQAAVQLQVNARRISEREWRHFQELFALARDGQWKVADRKCFEFAEAQLSRSRANPADTDHSHEHSQIHVDPLSGK